jgi:hypothetical protein
MNYASTLPMLELCEKKLFGLLNITKWFVLSIVVPDECPDFRLDIGHAGKPCQGPRVSWNISVEIKIFLAQSANSTMVLSIRALNHSRFISPVCAFSSFS